MTWSFRQLLAPLSALLLLVTACGDDPECGNGIVEAGEQCDDGNTANGDTCPSNCQPAPETDAGSPVCGNGRLEGTERCDDGNRASGDGCENDCTVTPELQIDSGVTDSGVSTDVDGGADAGDGTDAGSDTDAGSETDAGSDTDAGTETDAGSDTDAGTGTDAGSDTDAGTGTDAGSDTDAGTGTDAGSDTDAGSGTDAGSDVDAGTDAGSDVDAGMDAGSDLDAGPAPDAGSDAGTATDAGTGTDAGTDAGTATDAGTTQVALADFGPTGTFARSGFSGPTFPDALRVTLKEPAPVEVWVEMRSSSPAVVVEDTNLVRIPAGATSATVLVSADLAADPGVTKAVLTATLGNVSREATVRVIAVDEPVSLSMLTPESAVVAGGRTHTFTVVLDVPPAVDTEVQLAVQPASLGTAPVRVTVPANTLSAKFDFTAGSTAGQGQVSATLGARTAVSSVQVTGVGANHIVISEFAVRGSATGPAGDNDEFIELYNPTASTVDLGGWQVQYKSSTGPDYLSFSLPPDASIAPGSYYLVVSDAYPASAPVQGDASWEGLFHLSASATGGGHVRVGPPDLGTKPEDPLAVDTVGYGTANRPEGTAIQGYPPNGGSFERKANVDSTAASMQTGSDALKGNGHDSNVNAADIILRTTRQPQNASSPVEP
ncbi:lamin tail domain-containing protein [Pyxidicoccus trucidator]|uniref:lamin tail domain-containing protein n=1 Tax=Pyxidicoccus trucidator TaxID=2709662 RepID=UPI0013DAF8B6|nr:lamin tail domain-containing protein [Pyxidicoccus trucidator]